MAVLAGLLSLFFFSPRFAYWRLLPKALPTTTAEVIRAQAALVQLEHPLAEFPTEVNRVLHWRLFFPVLGHALHLPAAVYLALPHLGAILVLIFIAALVRYRGLDWRSTLALTTAAATCAWYFVSTGWLGYFDSWLILSLLAIVFAPAWPWAFLTVVVAPWIDERFVLFLPLAFLLRRNYRDEFPDSHPEPQALRLIGWTIAGLLPWLAVRVGALLVGHDATTTGYLQGMVARQRAVPPVDYLLGLWEGIRAGWFLVVAWFIFLWQEKNRLRWPLLVVLIATLLVKMIIASDIGRSMSVFLPIFVLGGLRWWRHRPATAGRALTAVCLINLFLPAMHVTGAGRWPIYYLYSELNVLMNPTPELTPKFHIDHAFALLNESRLNDAVTEASFGIGLAPTNAYARAIRANALFKLKRYAEALADQNEALKLEPHNPLFQSNRAQIRIEMGDLQGAVADLELVLGEPSAAPELKQQAKATLATLHDKIGR